MLRWRLLSAAIILTTLSLLVWLDLQCGHPQWFGRPGLVLLPFSLVVGLLAANEVLYFRPSGGLPDIAATDIAVQGDVKHWAVYLGTSLVIASSYAPLLWNEYPADCAVGRLGWPLYAMAAAVGLCFVAQMIGYRRGSRVGEAVARSVLVIAYIGLLISFWSPLRMIGDNAWGMVALLSLFVPVKMSDTLAYTFGKTMGRRKLAKNLSPGKTVEGLLGGLLGGCLGALAVFYLMAPWLTGDPTPASWVWVLVFGVLVTLAGVVGDLSESLLKRDGGVKNSSQWLRGLGGIMDIIDSLLAAGPVALALWSTGIFGPPQML